MIEHHHNHIDQRERWAWYLSIDAQPSLSPQLTTNQISCIIYPSCIDAQRIFPHKSLSTSASFAWILVPAPTLYQSFTRFHAQAQKRARTSLPFSLFLSLPACRPSGWSDGVVFCHVQYVSINAYVGASTLSSLSGPSMLSDERMLQITLLVGLGHIKT